MESFSVKLTSLTYKNTDIKLLCHCYHFSYANKTSDNY